MSPASSKVMGITVAVTAFVLLVSIAGLVLFYPKNEGGTAPATIGNKAVPKVVDPQDYLNVPATTPQPSAERRSGDIVVIYGDKPAVPAPLGTSGAAAAPAGGTASSPLPAASTLTAADSATVTPPPAAAAASAKAAAAPVASAKPTAAKTAPAIKAPAKAVTPSKDYWIQAASFAERAKADSLKEALGAKGISANITVKDINGKSWYRVRVGPYASSKEAEGWLGRVKVLNGCSEAYVLTQQK